MILTLLVTDAFVLKFSFISFALFVFTVYRYHDVIRRRRGDNQMFLYRLSCEMYRISEKNGLNETQ